jgi:DNA-binding PadR family transcriptional regulator
MSRVFAHGDLRLYLLKLLADEPRHGYDIIRLLEDRFYGLYTPSAGTIYPRLAALEEDGLVEHEVVDGRKVFRLTDAGRAELERRAEQVDDLEDRVRQSTRHLAREIKADVKASVRDLKRDLRDAARQVRHEGRRAQSADDHGAHDDLHRAARALHADLRAFGGDVVSAARNLELDRNAVHAVRSILADALTSIVDVLEGGPGGAKESGRKAADR